MHCLQWLLPFAILTPAAGLGQPPEYPPTRTVEVVDTIHGREVPDPYRWLEHGDDPEVQAWTAAQNALTRKTLDQFSQTRQTLLDELQVLAAADAKSPPEFAGGKYFYSYRPEGKKQPIVYVTEELSDPGRAVIDPNAFSSQGTVAIDWMYPAPNGQYIAYGRSKDGSEDSVLHLRYVDGAFDTALEIPNTRAASVAWDQDSEGFYYVRYPKAGEVPEGDEQYYRHVYYHKFGTDWRADPKVFGEGEPKEQWHDVLRSSDGTQVFLTASLDWTRNDVYLKTGAGQEFTPIAKGLDGIFNPEAHSGKLYLHTNWKAPRYRILTANIEQPGQSHWRELIGQLDGVIESMHIIDGRLVLHVMENAHSRLLVYSLEGTLLEEIKLPTLGTVTAMTGEPDRPELFFQFESFAFPTTVFRYNLRTQERSVFDEIKLAFDFDQLTTEQVWFESKDRTRVPMFVVRRKDLKLDGDNPTVLYGYGGFNISITPQFAAHALPFLKRGGIYAIANLRGGGEFGKKWHQAGRLENKQNVFDDMIAAGEKLIADNYTRPERLGARGGSNGGLLMGAMITQRPDLFHAIHCAVPLLDMVRYHKFLIARLWIPEYGSAEDPEQFKTLIEYSPYHHVEAGTDYPAVLFTTAESDTRVDPLHARKMAAALQAATTSDAPILLWIETRAGHGKGKPITKRLEEQADFWTFFMWQLGMLDDAD